MTATVPPTRQQQFRQLAVLIAVSFVDMLGFAIILPLLPFYALEMNASAEMIGWLIASFSIAQLIASPVWGRVSDKYGRRPALMIGLFASSLAFLVFGLAESLLMLFVSRVVQGLGGGTTGVAHAYVSDTVGPLDRARALGWLSAATAAGVMVGPAIGSAAIGLGNAAPGLIASGLCLINVVAAWRWLPESRAAETVTRVRKPVWHAAAQTLLHPSTRANRLIWIYGVGMLAFSLLTSILALWLEARFDVTASTIGYFFVYTGGLSLLMRSVLLGPIIDRLGEITTLRFGAVVLALGLLLFPLAQSVWWLAVIIPLVPIGTACLFPATTSLLAAAADPQELGTTMGVAQTFAGIARVAAPIAGTIAFQRLGIDAPFLLGGLTMAAMAWVAWRYIRPIPPPSEPDPVPA